LTFACGAGAACDVSCVGSATGTCGSANIKGETAASLAFAADVDGGFSMRNHVGNCINKNGVNNCWLRHGEDVARSAVVWCPDGGACAVSCDGRSSLYRHPRHDEGYHFLYNAIEGNGIACRPTDGVGCGKPLGLCQSLSVKAADLGAGSTVTLACTGLGERTCASAKIDTTNMDEGTTGATLLDTVCTAQGFGTCQSLVLTSSDTLPCALSCDASSTDACRNLDYRCGGENTLTCSGVDSCYGAQYQCGDGCELVCTDGCYGMTFSAGTGATVSCSATPSLMHTGSVHPAQKTCSNLNYVGPGLVRRYVLRLLSSCVFLC
jgi:hypothetical protein